MDLKRFSHGGIGRIHPPRKCKKEGCEVAFVPTKTNQEYCCPQHQIDAGNDRQRLRNKPLKDHNNKLLHNENVLKKMYNQKMLDKSFETNMNLLKYEGFHFDICTTREINKVSNRPIYWCFEYGIEGSQQADQFIIHIKENISYASTNKKPINR
jgi:hypothetical protein